MISINAESCEHLINSKSSPLEIMTGHLKFNIAL